jgi:hypothetical protein
VPVSSAKRALLVVAILVAVTASAAAIYFYRHSGALPGASSGHAPGIFTQLPPDAPVVAYIDVAALRRLKDSPLATVLGLASPGPQADKEYADFVRETGFDYTRDLDRVAIAAWPSNLGPPSPSTREPPGRLLALADGRFDTKKLEAYAARTGRVEKDSPRPIHRFSGQGPGQDIFLTIASADRVFLATDAALLALPAGSSAATTAPLDSAIRQRIERVAGAPLFAVARTDHLPANFYTNFVNSPELEHLARSVQGLSLAGKPSGDDIQLTLDAECDSMNSAFQIATLVDGFRLFGSAALADPKTRAQMTREQANFLKALIQQLKVDHQDRWVRLSLDVTPQMLNSAVPSKRGSPNK